MASRRRYATRSVLIVDDEPFFLRSLADALRPLRDEIEVTTAGGGREAIALIAERPFDLLITDVNMPEVDGLAVLTELMRRRPTVPAIVMTAYGAPELEDHARSIGAVGYLEKPIELASLIARVRETLAARQRDHIAGVTLYGLLQLLQIERKSCTLDVSSGELQGTLFFRNGNLVHAVAGELHGDRAMLEIGRWPNPEVEIEHVCQTDLETIHASLQELLLEAARLEDEDRHARSLADHAEGEATAVVEARAEAVEGQAIARARAWWTDLGKSLPESQLLTAIAIDLEQAKAVVLDGVADGTDAGEALAALCASAAVLVDGDRGAFERITATLGLAVWWDRGLGAALLLARSLEDRSAVAMFRRQTAAFNRGLLAG